MRCATRLPAAATRLSRCRLATINTATHFGLEREIGQIAPGRRADMIVTSDLSALPVERVYPARGVKAAEAGECLVEMPRTWIGPQIRGDSVHLGRALGADDFEIKAPSGADQVRVRVIGVVENQAPTEALEATLPVADGVIEGRDGRWPRSRWWNGTGGRGRS